MLFHKSILPEIWKSYVVFFWFYCSFVQFFMNMTWLDQQNDAFIVACSCDESHGIWKEYFKNAYKKTKMNRYVWQDAKQVTYDTI